MKISRELKVGVLAIVAILGAIWGYKYLKGHNIFSNSYTFHATYESIDQLAVSSPVYVAGSQIGTVSSIRLADDMKHVDVSFICTKDYDYPKNAIAELVSQGIMGQKAIALYIPEPCSGGNCAENGHHFASAKKGMIEGMLGFDPTAAGDKLGSSVATAFDSINTKLMDPNNDGRISRILRNLDALTLSIDKMSNSMNALISANHRSIQGMTKNLNTITKTIADNNIEIEQSLKNFSRFSSNLADSDISGTMDGFKETITGMSGSVEKMEMTLDNLNKALVEFKTLGAKMNSKDGSMGMLMNDKDLYVNLERSTKNLELLLQDFRINPKRYVNVSVFGKKQKKYIVPEDDPAFNK